MSKRVEKGCFIVTSNFKRGAPCRKRITCTITRATRVVYQQIDNSNIANQIHGFTIDFGQFILIPNKYPASVAQSADSAFHCMSQ